MISCFFLEYRSQLLHEIKLQKGFATEPADMECVQCLYSLSDQSLYTRYGILIHPASDKGFVAVGASEVAGLCGHKNEMQHIGPMKGLMKKYYGNRYRFLMVYEVVSVIRRKKQIMYQYFAIVLITMLLSQIEGKYIEYVLLFSILILGQNVVSYNVQNELRLVKKGFPL